jgi:hypothetical protein
MPETKFHPQRRRDGHVEPARVFEPDAAALIVTDTQRHWVPMILDRNRPYVLNQFHYDPTTEPAQREPAESVEH